MGEIIQIHVGQAGVQIADACWELYCLEHRINPYGVPCPCAYEPSFQKFFDRKDVHRAVARAVLVDSNPYCIDRIRTGQYSCIYDEKCLISGNEYSGCVFPRGYFTIGSELLDETMEAIRSVAESCSNLGGFLIYRSIGGGTGSGLGNLIEERLSDEYKKIPKMEFIIFPSPSIFPLTVEPYNAMIAAHLSMDLINCSFILENESLHEICTTKLNICNPKYKHLNRIIAQVASAFTTAQRFGCHSGISFAEYQTNLVPYPRIHYPIVSYAPFIPETGKGCCSVSTEELTNACFEPSNQLVRCYPIDGEFMSCLLLYRGNLTASSIDSSIAQLKNSENFRFVDWQPTDFKVGTNAKLPFMVPSGCLGCTDKSLLALSGNTAIQNVWQGLIGKFNNLYYLRTYVHYYTSEGMDEDCFNESLEDIKTLVEDYKEVESKLIESIDGSVEMNSIQEKQSKEDHSRSSIREDTVQSEGGESSRYGKDHPRSSIREDTVQSENGESSRYGKDHPRSSIREDTVQSEGGESSRYGNDHSRSSIREDTVQSENGESSRYGKDHPRSSIREDTVQSENGKSSRCGKHHPRSSIREDTVQSENGESSRYGKHHPRSSIREDTVQSENGESSRYGKHHPRSSIREDTVQSENGESSRYGKHHPRSSIREDTVQSENGESSRYGKDHPRSSIKEDTVQSENGESSRYGKDHSRSSIREDTVQSENGESSRYGNDHSRSSIMEDTVQSEGGESSRYGNDHSRSSIMEDTVQSESGEQFETKWDVNPFTLCCDDSDICKGKVVERCLNRNTCDNNMVERCQKSGGDRNSYGYSSKILPLCEQCACNRDICGCSNVVKRSRKYSDIRTICGCSNVAESCLQSNGNRGTCGCSNVAERSLQCNGNRDTCRCSNGNRDTCRCSNCNRDTCRCSNVAERSLQCNGNRDTCRCSNVAERSLQCNGNRDICGCRNVAERSLQCNGNRDTCRCSNVAERSLQCNGNRDICGCRNVAERFLQCNGNRDTFRCFNVAERCQQSNGNRDTCGCSKVDERFLNCCGNKGALECSNEVDRWLQCGGNKNRSSNPAERRLQRWDIYGCSNSNKDTCKSSKVVDRWLQCRGNRDTCGCSNVANGGNRDTCGCSNMVERCQKCSSSMDTSGSTITSLVSSENEIAKDLPILYTGICNDDAPIAPLQQNNCYMDHYNWSSTDSYVDEYGMDEGYLMPDGQNIMGGGYIIDDGYYNHPLTSQPVDGYLRLDSGFYSYNSSNPLSPCNASNVFKTEIPEDNQRIISGKMNPTSKRSKYFNKMSSVGSSEIPGRPRFPIRSVKENE